MTLLNDTRLPSGIRELDERALSALSQEVRALIIDTVSRTGGHLAANLGVVELTIALLKVFDPARDRLLWDTSHQCYAYKILTDRKDRFGSLRQHGGISGFLKRDESPYDAFGAGHAGTALSAALGMAVARDRRGGSEHVVAIVGDAGASCGISFEALNNVAGTTGRLVVVLNDNEMSIAGNVGSLSRYFGSLLSSPRYNRWKKSVENAARKLRMGWLRRSYYRMEEAIKGLFLRSVLFEEFGLRYIGPIDGHSIPALVDALSIARDSEKPILVHVSTTKGLGYPPAELAPERWHGTPAFEVDSGVPVVAPGALSYSAVFGKTLVALAERDPKIVAITAGMCAGTGLAEFAARFPNRFFDVGISEEHAAVFAAGLAASGLRPVFAVYSTFAQRVVDNLIHDVCLQGLPAILCLDRAGIVGDDGPTHHGVFDIPLFRPAPDLVYMQPKDEAELAHMLFTATRLDGPAVIRYPRGAGRGTPLPDEFKELPVGRAEAVREGRDVGFWALGDMLSLAEVTAALLESEGVSCGIVNARFIRPLDVELLRADALAKRLIVTFENGVLSGGFGSGVAEALNAMGLRAPVLAIGWPDAFIPHGSSAQLMKEAGLEAPAVAAQVRRRLAALSGSG